MFFLTDAMASSGMTVLPFFRMGVTSTSSHLMGACSRQHQDFTAVILISLPTRPALLSALAE